MANDAPAPIPNGTAPLHWRLTADDCRKARSETSGHETFTRLYIRYKDPVTGEVDVVHAENHPDGYPTLERVVPAHPLPPASLTREAAQALANEAAAVLGGKPVERWWLEVPGEALLDRSDGNKRRAGAIAHGDQVVANFGLRKQDHQLYVFDVTSESDGTVSVSLSDRDDYDRRLDVELKLNGL